MTDPFADPAADRPADSKAGPRTPRPGRRRGPAAAEAPEPMFANPRPALTAVGVLAGAALIAQLAGGGGGSAAAVADEVRTAAVACPKPVLRGTDVRNRVTLAVPPRLLAAPATDDAATPGATPAPTASPAADDGAQAAAETAAEGAGEAEAAGEAAEPGAAALTDLGSDRARSRLSAPGFVSLDVAPSTVPAQVARGIGPLAPGIAAEMVTQADSGPARGLSGAACVLPGTRFWFVGASTAAGRRDRLVLTNADVTQAVVDLRFWTDNGPVEVPNSTDIAIGPESAREIPLDGMVPGRARLAIGVVVTRGRVAAALHDQDTPGTASHGTDWIASAPEPARTVVIPGVPDGTLGRRLQLLAPDSDAIVNVRLISKDNDFVPAGVDTLALEAGKVAEFDLSPAADAQSVGVVITSDRPVLGAVRVTRTAGMVADVAYAVAAAPLTTPATLADGRGGKWWRTRLLLTAPEGAATVVVRPLLAGGPGPERVVTIAAGRSVSIDPETSGATRYAVVVTPRPGSGPVFGARVLRANASDISILPLQSGRFTVVLPQVVSDLTATTEGD